jgi:hypothetical protein
MRSFAMIAVLVCGLVTNSASVTAAPAKQWFLTFNVYTRTNRGSTNLPFRMIWDGAFETRNQCRAKYRLVTTKCRGVFPDQGRGYDVGRVTGTCQHLQQPPKPKPDPALVKNPGWTMDENGNVSDVVSRDVVMTAKDLELYPECSK